MIRAIIIDDEVQCIETLASLLKECCPEVYVMDECRSAQKGLHAIEKLKPDLVFLDVEMPVMNGFEMLERLPTINFELVFTTSYDHHAIRAIRLSALDYLLKPIDKEELKTAMQRVDHKLRPSVSQQLEILLGKVRQPSLHINKIALPTMEGLHMVNVENIISCQSDSNYTIIQLKGKQKIIVSKTLKDIEDMLEGFSFIRVHHSYMVNINEVNKYVKGEGGYLVMSDNSVIDVSRSKKELVLKKLQGRS